MPPGSRRSARRLRGGPLAVAVAVVVVVGFGLGLWLSGALDGDDGGQQVAVGDGATTTAPATTTTTAPSTTSTATTEPDGGPSTTDTAPPATSVPPGAPGTGGVLTVGYDGQEALGRLVLAPGETRWIILANEGGAPLTWTARSTGAAALGDGTSYAGVLDPGQSGGVPVTGVATAAPGDEGTVTVGDGTASTVVRVAIG